MEYLRKDGIDTGDFKAWDWEKKSWGDMTRPQAEKLMDSLGKFFMNHTKQELLKLAVENRFQLGPCNNAQDILNHPQLEARKFWQEIDYPETGRKFKYPGGAVVSSEKYVGPYKRAPKIGEHNDEILKNLNARSVKPAEKTIIRNPSRA